MFDFGFDFGSILGAFWLHFDPPKMVKKWTRAVRMRVKIGSNLGSIFWSILDGPRAPEELPKTTPGGPKRVQDHPKRRPGPPQDAQRPPYDHPRSPQDRPRPTQDRPRSLQDQVFIEKGIEKGVEEDSKLGNSHLLGHD